MTNEVSDGKLLLNFDKPKKRESVCVCVCVSVCLCVCVSVCVCVCVFDQFSCLCVRAAVWRIIMRLRAWSPGCLFVRARQVPISSQCRTRLSSTRCTVRLVSLSVCLALRFSHTSGRLSSAVITSSNPITSQNIFLARPLGRVWVWSSKEPSSSSTRFFYPIYPPTRLNNPEYL